MTSSTPSGTRPTPTATSPSGLDRSPASPSTATTASYGRAAATPPGWWAAAMPQAGPRTRTGTRTEAGTRTTTGTRTYHRATRGSCSRLRSPTSRPRTRRRCECSTSRKQSTSCASTATWRGASSRTRAFAPQWTASRATRRGCGSAPRRATWTRVPVGIRTLWPTRICSSRSAARVATSSINLARRSAGCCRASRSQGTTALAVTPASLLSR